MQACIYDSVPNLPLLMGWLSQKLKSWQQYMCLSYLTKHTARFSPSMQQLDGIGSFHVYFFGWKSRATLIFSHWHLQSFNAPWPMCANLRHLTVRNGGSILFCAFDLSNRIPLKEGKNISWREIGNGSTRLHVLEGYPKETPSIQQPWLLPTRPAAGCQHNIGIYWECQNVAMNVGNVIQNGFGGGGGELTVVLGYGVKGIPK